MAGLRSGVIIKLRQEFANLQNRTAAIRIEWIFEAGVCKFTESSRRHEGFFETRSCRVTESQCHPYLPKLDCAGFLATVRVLLTKYGVYKIYPCAKVWECGID